MTVVSAVSVMSAFSLRARTGCLLRIDTRLNAPIVVAIQTITEIWSSDKC
ncbi:Uncharacterised protein [Mycobacteroides abscessus subsp. abscessus]|nr:Uncharacterised protein [Mycobacteroides abscessus subsp. abscessus]